MVWFHSQVRYVSSGYVKVVEVFRCKATLDNGFSANTHTGICSHRGYDRPPGFIYHSEEECAAERRLYKTWESIRKEIAAMNDLPEDMTRRKLLQVRRMLELGD